MQHNAKSSKPISYPVITRDNVTRVIILMTQARVTLRTMVTRVDLFLQNL